MRILCLFQTAPADALKAAAHDERNTTQHLAQLGKSRNRLVDRNGHDGGAPAAAGGAEQDHAATQSHGAPQAPNRLGAMTAAEIGAITRCP